MPHVASAIGFCGCIDPELLFVSATMKGSSKVLTKDEVSVAFCEQQRWLMRPGHPESLEMLLGLLGNVSHEVTHRTSDTPHAT